MSKDRYHARRAKDKPQGYAPWVRSGAILGASAGGLLGSLDGVRGAVRGAARGAVRGGAAGAAVPVADRLMISESKRLQKMKTAHIASGFVKEAGLPTAVSKALHKGKQVLQGDTRPLQLATARNLRSHRKELRSFRKGVESQRSKAYQGAIRRGERQAIGWHYDVKDEAKRKVRSRAKALAGAGAVGVGVAAASRKKEAGLPTMVTKALHKGKQVLQGSAARKKQLGAARGLRSARTTERGARRAQSQIGTLKSKARGAHARGKMTAGQHAATQKTLSGHQATMGRLHGAAKARAGVAGAAHRSAKAQASDTARKRLTGVAAVGAGALAGGAAAHLRKKND